MNLTTFVDVAIGLSVMYLSASLFVTIVNEYIAQFWALRANQLKTDLKKLIDDEKVREALKENPALEPFFRDSQTFLVRLKTLFGPSSAKAASPTQTSPSSEKAASFVDPNVLAQQVVGNLSNGRLKGAEQLLDALNKLSTNSKLKTQLEALARTAGEDMDGFVRKVGAYLDRTLAAMGEGYKQKMQVISLVIGFVVALTFNLDTVFVASHLYRDKEARDATVAVALAQTNDPQFNKCMGMDPEARRKAGECAQLSGPIDLVLGRSATLGKLPIGWASMDDAMEALLGLSAPKADAPRTDAAARPPLVRWIGLLLTALAISLGACFWFDLLNRLVNMRNGMRKPEVDTKPKGDTT